MANQINLDLLWADLGGKTDPTDAKWEAGWVAEIPTYQNFNYVLHATGSNILHLAENGEFQWQQEISYEVGATVREGGFEWYCITANSGQQPSLDNTNSYWVNGKVVGRTPVTPFNQKHGLYVADINTRTLNTWTGNDVTIENKSALVALNTTGSSLKNLVFGNVGGELVVVDVGTTNVPDGRDISISKSAVQKIYHEGNKPDQSDVSGTIPDSPQDGTIYARRAGNWVKVSSTEVQTQPPPSLQGSGAGWYNLSDGQLYLDINDGDSSQWVPASPSTSRTTLALDAEVVAGTKEEFRLFTPKQLALSAETHGGGGGGEPSVEVKLEVTLVANEEVIDVPPSVKVSLYLYDGGILVLQPNPTVVRDVDNKITSVSLGGSVVGDELVIYYYTSLSEVPLLDSYELTDADIADSTPTKGLVSGEQLATLGGGGGAETVIWSGLSYNTVTLPELEGGKYYIYAAMSGVGMKVPLDLPESVAGSPLARYLLLGWGASAGTGLQMWQNVETAAVGYASFELEDPDAIFSLTKITKVG